MVDYSHFEKITISSDEEDEEEKRGPPGVYRVGAGEKVTIPGRNVQISHAGRDHAGAIVPARGAASSRGNAASNSGGGGGAAGGGASSAVATGAVSSHTSPTHTLNGGETDAYTWAQDATSVTLYVFVPPSTKASALDIIVTRTHCTVGKRGGAAAAAATAAGDHFFSGHLYGDVEAPDEPEDLDWEMATVSVKGVDRRSVQVTVNKVSAIRGVVVWWRAALKGGPEIDVEAIPARAKGAAKTQKFQDALAEAQVMFAAKMAGREDNRVEVDIGDDDDDAA